jgi:hypothetical protein
MGRTACHSLNIEGSTIAGCPAFAGHDALLNGTARDERRDPG